jgi:sporulation protein YlmC with PRC-barrel domain
MYREILLLAVLAVLPGEPTAAQQQGVALQSKAQLELASPPPLSEPPVYPGDLSYDAIIGKNVVDTGGNEIGHVSDIILSKDTGQAKLIVVEFGDFLGLSGKQVGILWGKARPARETEALEIDMTEEQIRAAETFDYAALDAAE